MKKKLIKVQSDDATINYVPKTLQISNTIQVGKVPALHTEIKHLQFDLKPWNALNIELREEEN